MTSDSKQKSIPSGIVTSPIIMWCIMYALFHETYWYFSNEERLLYTIIVLQLFLKVKWMFYHNNHYVTYRKLRMSATTKMVRY